jgi:hypothetical protein
MDSLAFLVFLAQALHASAAATLTLVHAPLFAFGNEPAPPAQILHDAALHHFFIEATEETVEGLAFSEFDSHGEITPSIFHFFERYTTNRQAHAAWRSYSRPVTLWSYITIASQKCQIRFFDLRSTNRKAERNRTQYP